jgi:hypothetical protein
MGVEGAGFITLWIYSGEYIGLEKK